METAVITKAGKKQCGKFLIKKIKMNTSKSVFKRARYQSPQPNDNLEIRRKFKYLTAQEIYELNLKQTEVRINSDIDDGLTKLNVSGTLENIKLYAERILQSDKDQIIAFIYIVSAFVLSLYHQQNKT